MKCLVFYFIAVNVYRWRGRSAAVLCLVHHESTREKICEGETRKILEIFAVASSHLLRCGEHWSRLDTKVRANPKFGTE